MELSEEQRKKIEENRREALAKLAGSKRLPQNLDQRGDLPPKTIHGRPTGDHTKTAKKGKNRTIKTRLESAAMVAVVMEGGGDVLLFKGLQGAYYRDGLWHVPLLCYKEFLSRAKVDEGVSENIIDIL
jgi:hypothetical protein